MSAPVQVGREATHGTVAATTSAAPVNFSNNMVRSNTIPEEQRGGQDAHFTVIPGQQHTEWTVSDSYVYHDKIGFWVTSAMGLPVSTVVETTAYDSVVFKFLDDPASLTFKYSQPRRVVQSYQTLWNVVDKMAFSFDAAGLLKWTASGVGMAETEISNPTWTYTTTRPMTAWQGTVTLLGGGTTSWPAGPIRAACPSGWS